MTWSKTRRETGIDRNCSCPVSVVAITTHPELRHQNHRKKWPVQHAVGLGVLNSRGAKPCTTYYYFSNAYDSGKKRWKQIEDRGKNHEGPLGSQYFSPIRQKILQTSRGPAQNPTEIHSRPVNISGQYFVPMFQAGPEGFRSCGNSIHLFQLSTTKL